MRLLFHVEPLIMHNRPFHYWAWLDRAASMARTLAATDHGYEFRFLLNEALAARATAAFEPDRSGDPRRGQGLPASWIVPVRQEQARRHFDAPNVAILEGFQHSRWPSDVVAACGEDARRSLSGFEPDVLVTYTPAPHLAAAFPGALLLHGENGMFSRRPFPPTQFFDPLGLYARSLLGVHADALLERRPSAEERAWLDRLRERHRAWLLAASPFHDLERALRLRFRRLALLPLQFGGEVGFDANGPFRSQGEYLFHVLERLPEGVGLVVSEHPTARWLGDYVDDETRGHVREAWPQVTWVDPFVADHGSQMLMLHVDDVIGLSSSLGLQALFWQKPLVTVGWSHLRPYAAADGIEHLDPDRPRGAIVDRDGAVAWMLRHYFVPETLCLRDAEWIGRFLRVARERNAAGRTGLDFYDAATGEAALERLLAPPPPPAARVPVPPGLLRNGGFERWKAAPDGGETPLHWELIAGGCARLVRGDPAGGPAHRAGGPESFVRLEVAAAAEGRGLLLQRVPDLDRLSGALVTLEFSARGPRDGALSVYLYQQFGAPDAPVQGTPARAFVLGPDWRRFTYTAAVPGAPRSPRGPNHHTEVVFLLAAAAAESFVEIADVALGPGRLDA
jgi:hypothetical protein